MRIILLKCSFHDLYIGNWSKELTDIATNLRKVIKMHLHTAIYLIVFVSIKNQRYQLVYLQQLYCLIEIDNNRFIYHYLLCSGNAHQR